MRNISSAGADAMTRTCSIAMFAITPVSCATISALRTYGERGDPNSRNGVLPPLGKFNQSLPVRRHALIVLRSRFPHTRRGFAVDWRCFVPHYCDKQKNSECEIAYGV